MTPEWIKGIFNQIQLVFYPGSCPMWGTEVYGKSRGPKKLDLLGRQGQWSQNKSENMKGVGNWMWKDVALSPGWHEGVVIAFAPLYMGKCEEPPQRKSNAIVILYPNACVPFIWAQGWLIASCTMWGPCSTGEMWSAFFHCFGVPLSPTKKPGNKTVNNKLSPNKMQPHNTQKGSEIFLLFLTGKARSSECKVRLAGQGWGRRMGKIWSHLFL